MHLAKSIQQSATALTAAEFDDAFRTSMATRESGVLVAVDERCPQESVRSNLELDAQVNSEVKADAIQHALTLCSNERWEDAITVLESLVDCDPTNTSVVSAVSVAWNNLGNRHRRHARYSEACEAFVKAIEYAPQIPEIHRNYALTLIELGDLNAAKAHIQTALRLRPNWPEAIETLAVVLGSQAEHPQAINLLNHVTDQRPALTSAWRNLGVLCGLEGRVEEAENAFIRLSQLEPHAAHYQLLASLLCPEVVSNREEYSQRLSRIEASIDRCFSAYVTPMTLNDLPSLVGNPSVNWQYYHDSLRPMKEQLAAWVRSNVDSIPTQHDTVPGRMGFVVTTGHERAFATSMMPILARIQGFDRSQKLIFCSPYSKSILQKQDASREVTFVDLGSSLTNAVESIRQTACSLLYHWEVGTDPLNYLIPFFKLAPCQMTSWGHQVTSGIKEIDFYLSSRWLEPDQSEEDYTEQLLKLDSLMLYRPRLARRLDKSIRDRLCDGSHRIYFCPHRVGKLHPDMDRVLAGIQQLDAQSIIVLLADEERPSASALLARLQTAGVDTQKLRLVGFLPDEAYRGLLASADALLDGPHFSGANSTYDAIELGRPIVGWRGEFQRGRYTTACLDALGLEQLIASDADSMTETAVALARNAGFRREAEQRIASTSDLLFSDMRCVHEHERVLMQLAHCQGGETMGLLPIL